MVTYGIANIKETKTIYAVPDFTSNLLIFSGIFEDDKVCTFWLCAYVQTLTENAMVLRGQSYIKANISRSSIWATEHHQRQRTVSKQFYVQDGLLCVIYI